MFTDTNKRPNPVITVEKPEGVEVEPFETTSQRGLELVWRVEYADGEILNQVDPDGTKHKYTDIDRSRPFRFDLIRPDNFVVCSVFIRDTQRLIYRRRTLMQLNNPERTVMYLVGWQETSYTNNGPRNITAIMYVYPDGSIALDGTRNNLELLSMEV